MQERPRVLIPIRILEGESIPEGLPALVQNAHVILLGYYVVPDQTATDQAQNQFEDKATQRLDAFVEILEDAGATVESRLVFTHHGQKTIDRITAEHDCLAILIPNATRPIENVLVAIRGVRGIDRFVQLVSGLFAPMGVGVTLYHVAEKDETDADAETLLAGISGRLSEEGVPTDSITTEIGRGEDHQKMIIDTANDHDAIVMGESDTSVATLLFGMTAEQVAKQFLGPVFVIQHENPDNEEEADIQVENGE